MGKIKADNAYQFIRHCKALAAVGVAQVDGLPEFIGLDLFHRFNRLEKKAHRLTTAGCNRELTEAEEKQLEKLGARARGLIRPEFRERFRLNSDARGYALKLKGRPNAGETVSGPELPGGMYEDWGGYGILAPEF